MIFDLLSPYLCRVSKLSPYTQGRGADDLYEGDIEVSQPITQTVCSFSYQLINDYQLTEFQKGLKNEENRR